MAKAMSYCGVNAYLQESFISIYLPYAELEKLNKDYVF